MNNHFTDTSNLDDAELCDQCRALAFAMTELTHPIARDTLLWVLVERLDMLGLRFADEETILAQPEKLIAHFETSYSNSAA